MRLKADIGREMELEELRKLQSEVHDAARSIEETLHKEISNTNEALNQTIAPALDAIRGTETTVPPATPATPEPATPAATDVAAPYGIGHAVASDGKSAEPAAAPPKP